MEKINFQRITDEHDRIIGLEISGMLILENAQSLHKELVGMVDLLSKHVKISISDLQEIDISCIQLIAAFIRQMDDLKVTYQFEWNIDDDLNILMEHVGLSTELFMNN
jgi:ABC-type transporter Mla MlaB component